MTVAETLAGYAVAETQGTLSPEVRHHACRAVVDWFASLLPGSQVAPATMLNGALADEANGKALVYVDGRRAPLRTAALINATASHSIEFDDIFRDAVYHPGCPVISAALAAAQAHGASGAALLRAVVVGYEVSTRIGVAVQPSHYRFWHTTGTIGTFGAAAAVASIMRLDAVSTAHALASAGTMAAALQQAFRSDAMSKPLHAGHAAEAGALAAMSAAQGVTGALDVLEGEAGFGAAMSTGADWTRATDGLGERYNITAMTFKNHGCCGHSFAAIDGALAAAAGLAARDIARIRIGTYRVALEVTGRQAVATPFEGRFSTRFTVASALVHGSVRLDAFTAARLADEQVQDLMQRIDLVEDPGCDAAFPGRRSAVVEIETTDGRRLHHHQTTRKGDPEEPLSDAELAAKFMELVSPVSPDGEAGQLLGTLLALNEQGPGVIATLGLGGRAG